MDGEAELRDFVAARVDEDEAAIRELPAHATGRWEPWRSKHDMHVLAELRPGRPAPPEIDYNVPSDAYDASWIEDWTPVARWENDAAYGFEHAAVARLVARHDPARVLREVAAKRDHLAMWDEAIERRERAVKLAGSDSELHRRGAVTQRAEANGYCEAVLRLVLADAAVYSDHPDYRAAWAATEGAAT